MFTVEKTIYHPPSRVWKRLTDWEGHAEWVPATAIEVDTDDPNRFTAFSGVRPVVLEDRMRVVGASFDGSSGKCRIEKVGPTLFGKAEFSVAPYPNNATLVIWRETLSVPYLPRYFAPLASAAGRVLFGWALRRMARSLRAP